MLVLWGLVNKVRESSSTTKTEIQTKRGGSRLIHRPICRPRRSVHCGAAQRTTAWAASSRGRVQFYLPPASAIAAAAVGPRARPGHFGPTAVCLLGGVRHGRVRAARVVVHRLASRVPVFSHGRCQCESHRRTLAAACFPRLLPRAHGHDVASPTRRAQTAKRTQHLFRRKRGRDPNSWVRRSPSKQPQRRKTLVDSHVGARPPSPPRTPRNTVSAQRQWG